MKRRRRSGGVSRRDFLKVASIGASAVTLGACSPQALASWLVPTPIVPPTPLLMPAGPAATPTPLPSATPSPTNTSTRTPSPTETSTPRPFPTWTGTPTETPTPSPTVEGSEESGTGHLCFVLWDHQLAMYHYKPRNPDKPLPETCPLKSGARNRITPAWEEYWKGILHLLNPDITDQQFEKGWKGLTAPARAFTNKTNPGSGNFALASLTCGGATHEMVTGEPEKQYMRIYTLNINDPPPTIPSRPQDINMLRHFFATTGSTKRLSNGTYAVYGFPQFENCIVPLVSPDDTDLIEVSRIKIVSSIQRPYNT
jgi:hypothetical protein